MSIQVRKSMRLGSILILFAVTVWATPAVLEAQTLAASGEWRTTAGDFLAGSWKATITTPSFSGTVTGLLETSGIPSLEKANLVGYLSKSEVVLTALSTDSDQAKVAEFSGRLNEGVLSGVLTLVDGTTFTWTGGWGLKRASLNIASDSLAALDKGIPQEVIVTLDARRARAEAAALTRDRYVISRAATRDMKREKYADLSEQVLSKVDSKSVQVLRTYRYIPQIVVTVTSRRALEELSTLPEVLDLNSNDKLPSALASSLSFIHQPQVEATLGYTGLGQTIAILDRGVEYTRAPALWGDCPTGPGGLDCRIVHLEDVAPDDGMLDDSALGHGTIVSSIAGSVAPDAELYVLDVYDGETLSVDALIAGADQVIQDQPDYNIYAINLSTGAGSYNSECINGFFTPSAIELESNDIAPVISSGNDGYINGISTPACSPGAFSVGALYDSNLGSRTFYGCTDSTTDADKVACFSNSAPILDALAPGVDIDEPSGLGSSGTSFAAPFIAGAVAVLRARPGYAYESIQCTERRITHSGVQVTDQRNGLTFPRLDLLAAALTLPTVGDCNYNGVVSIDELITGVAIGLGTKPVSSCYPFDVDSSGTISIDELIAGVNSANQDGCPMS